MEPALASDRLALMPSTRPATRVRRALAPVSLLLGLALAACGGPGSGAASTGAPSASPAPAASVAPSAPLPSTSPVTSAQEATDAVRARVPLFDGFKPKDPEAIGEASSVTAEPAPGGGWTVTFVTGWGDCEAGCINHHSWTWAVAADGTTTFVAEDGAPLPAEVLAALAASSVARTGVGGRATAGPTCPVEQPGDPACAPRMVAGAVLVARDAAGTEVARATTDGSGLFRLALPAGDYTLEAAPVEGLMGTPAPQPVTLAAGAETWVDLAYDTGIR